MEMKTKKIVSVILIGLLMVSSVFLMSSCGKKEEEKPANLEEYVSQSEDAAEELDEIGESMTNEILDGEVDVKDNSIVMTLKLKETYKSKDFSKISDQFAEQMENYRDLFTDTLDSVESESGIKGAEIQVIVLNGDGEEIFSDTYTKD